MQSCSISIDNAMEKLLSCTKPLKYKNTNSVPYSWYQSYIWYAISGSLYILACMHVSWTVYDVNNYPRNCLYKRINPNMNFLDVRVMEKLDIWMAPQKTHTNTDNRRWIRKIPWICDDKYISIMHQNYCYTYMNNLHNFDIFSKLLFYAYAI